MAEIEFFFDCSSPWTYLAFHNIQPVAKAFNATIHWRPFLVGGVFNTINPSVYNTRDAPVPAKQAYGKKDLQDWARLAGLQILDRPTVFPVNSVKAMRACIVLEADGRQVAFATAVFEAYWGQDRNISETAVLEDICQRLGIDADRLFTAIDQQPVKDRLRANTQELMDRGGYGSPTVFIDKTDMYFGNDRMPLIAEALRRAAGS